MCASVAESVVCKFPPLRFLECAKKSWLTRKTKWNSAVQKFTGDQNPLFVVRMVVQFVLSCDLACLKEHPHDKTISASMRCTRAGSRSCNFDKNCGAIPFYDLGFERAPSRRPLLAERLVNPLTSIDTSLSLSLLGCRCTPSHSAVTFLHVLRSPDVFSLYRSGKSDTQGRDMHSISFHLGSFP